jgi:import inner membrane translocase subunit TIM10
MYRLTTACHKKCIAPKYREPDLQKGEAVCIDRNSEDITLSYK